MLSAQTLHTATPSPAAVMPPGCGSCSRTRQVFAAKRKHNFSATGAAVIPVFPLKQIIRTDCTARQETLTVIVCLWTECGCGSAFKYCHPQQFVRNRGFLLVLHWNKSISVNMYSPPSVSLINTRGFNSNLKHNKQDESLIVVLFTNMPNGNFVVWKWRQNEWMRHIVSVQISQKAGKSGVNSVSKSDGDSFVHLAGEWRWPDWKIRGLTV